MRVTDPVEARRLAGTVPVTFMIFDVLHLGDRSTVSLPYAERRRLLDGIGPDGPAWRTPPAWIGGGADVLAATKAQGLEGVIAKRLGSPYLAGTRSPAWRKVKNLLTLDVVVGGWRPGAGRREGTVGSLLLGVHTAAGLAFVGHVGTGFTDAMLDDLAARLAPLAADVSPFDAAPVPREFARRSRWVRPELAGEVGYGELTLNRTTGWLHRCEGVLARKLANDHRYQVVGDRVHSSVEVRDR